MYDRFCLAGQTKGRLAGGGAKKSSISLYCLFKVKVILVCARGFVCYNSFQNIFDFDTLTIAIRNYPGVFHPHLAHVFLELISLPVIAEDTNGDPLRLTLLDFTAKIGVVVKILLKVLVLKGTDLDLEDHTLGVVHFIFDGGSSSSAMRESLLLMLDWS